mmetsp:Transcript_65221/g.113704  ORF Transcript_65221/g.113704 Transcript_65221/m.113704 type:complete len:209 (+) Transcript_65221:492-1118(+)
MHACRPRWRSRRPSRSVAIGHGQGHGKAVAAWKASLVFSVSLSQHIADGAGQNPLLGWIHARLDHVLRSHVCNNLLVIEAIPHQPIYAAVKADAMQPLCNCCCLITTRRGAVHLCSALLRCWVHWRNLKHLHWAAWCGSCQVDACWSPWLPYWRQLHHGESPRRAHARGHSTSLHRCSGSHCNQHLCMRWRARGGASGSITTQCVHLG